MVFKDNLLCYFRGQLTHARKLPLNAHADVSSGASALNFGQSLHLDPTFVYASSKGSSESEHLKRLA